MKQALLVKNGGSKSIFPSGYKFKALALGDTFPGFGPDIIPICQNVSNDTSAQHTGGGSTSKQNRLNVNGVLALKSDYSIGGLAQYNNFFLYLYPTAYNVFLPIFFNFNYTLLQNTVKTGTITAWLQRGG